MLVLLRTVLGRSSEARGLDFSMTMVKMFMLMSGSTLVKWSEVLRYSKGASPSPSDQSTVPHVAQLKTQLLIHFPYGKSIKDFTVIFAGRSLDDMRTSSSIGLSWETPYK